MTKHAHLTTEQGRRALAGDQSVLSGVADQIAAAIPAAGTTAPRAGKDVGTTAAMLSAQLTEAGIAHGTEKRLGLILGRKWKIDLVLGPRWIGGVLRPVAIEVDGAVHRIAERTEGDREKARGLQAMGFHFLPFTAKEVRSGLALETISALVGGGA